MKLLLKKISSALLALGFLVSAAPLAYAQEDLFDPLDTIQDRLGQDGVTVIDYSDSQWGNIPREIQTQLATIQVESLRNMIDLVLPNVGLTGLTEEEILKSPEFQAALEAELLKSPTFSDDQISLNQNGIQTLNALVNEFRFRGESQISQVVVAVANLLRNLLGALAVLWIVVAGTQMIMAQGEESVITEQRKAITYAVIGLVIVLILERMIFILYGAPSPDVTTGLATNQIRFEQEIFGILSFIKTLIGSIAILMIVVSGIRTFFAQGEEDQITKQRKSVLWIMVGLGIIVVNEVIINNLYIDPIRRSGDQITIGNVQRVVNLLGGIAEFLLSLMGLIAFGALIYGAATIIMNLGQQENIEKGKKIVRNAIIGIVIALSAFAIVATVIRFEG